MSRTVRGYFRYFKRALKKAKTVLEVAREEVIAKEVLPTSPGYDTGAYDAPALALVGPLVEVVPDSNPTPETYIGGYVAVSYPAGAVLI